MVWARSGRSWLLAAKAPTKTEAVRRLDAASAPWGRTVRGVGTPSDEASFDGQMNAPVIAKLTDPQRRDILLEFDIDVLHGSPPASGGAVAIVFDSVRNR